MGKISFHVSELSQFTTKNNQNWEFYKLPEILAENSVIPGNSRREFLAWPIPGNSRTGIPGGLAGTMGSGVVQYGPMSHPSVLTCSA